MSISRKAAWSLHLLGMQHSFCSAVSSTTGTEKRAASCQAMLPRKALDRLDQHLVHQMPQMLGSIYQLTGGRQNVETNCHDCSFVARQHQLTRPSKFILVIAGTDGSTSRLPFTIEGMKMPVPMHPTMPQAHSTMMTPWGDRLLSSKPVGDTSA